MEREPSRAPRTGNVGTTAAREYAAARTALLSPRYDSVPRPPPGNSNRGSVLPSLSPATQPAPSSARLTGSNSFKRTGWATPRAPTSDDNGSVFPDIDCSSRPGSQSSANESSEVDPDKVVSRRPEELTSTPPSKQRVAPAATDNERAQQAYMEHIYATISMENAEFDTERQGCAQFAAQPASDRLTIDSEYAPDDTIHALTASFTDYDDSVLNFSPLVTDSGPPTASPRRFRTSASPSPSQPKRPSAPTSARQLSKDQVELCSALGKNAELRIRAREMERSAEVSILELEHAQKQMKLAERRMVNREEKLRGLLKEKMHWQKDMKDLRDQVVEEKMRQVDIFRRMETVKRDSAAQLEDMAKVIQETNEENQVLRTQLAELNAQQAYQAKRMDELARQAKEEKDNFAACIAETRTRFKDWRDNEASALRAAREQALTNLRTEFELKIARHQEEKQKLRERVKDLEVSLKLVQKDRTLSPLELSLRKATILGSRDSVTSEADMIEAQARIRELENLLEHTQEYQKRQENMIKVSEATISRLIQEREVTALENLSMRPVMAPPTVSSDDVNLLSPPDFMATSPLSRSPRDARKPSQYSVSSASSNEKRKPMTSPRPSRSTADTKVAEERQRVAVIPSPSANDHPTPWHQSESSSELCQHDGVSPTTVIDLEPVTKSKQIAATAVESPSPTQQPNTNELFLASEVARLQKELEQVKLQEVERTISNCETAHGIDNSMMLDDRNGNSRAISDDPSQSSETAVEPAACTGDFTEEVDSPVLTNSIAIDDGSQSGSKESHDFDLVADRDVTNPIVNCLAAEENNEDILVREDPDTEDFAAYPNPNATTKEMDDMMPSELKHVDDVEDPVKPLHPADCATTRSTVEADIHDAATVEQFRELESDTVETDTTRPNEAQLNTSSSMQTLEVVASASTVAEPSILSPGTDVPAATEVEKIAYVPIASEDSGHSTGILEANAPITPSDNEDVTPLGVDAYLDEFDIDSTGDQGSIPLELVSSSETTEFDDCSTPAVTAANDGHSVPVNPSSDAGADECPVNNSIADAVSTNDNEAGAECQSMADPIRHGDIVEASDPPAGSSIAIEGSTAAELLDNTVAVEQDRADCEVSVMVDLETPIATPPMDIKPENASAEVDTTATADSVHASGSHEPSGDEVLVVDDIVETMPVEAFETQKSDDYSKPMAEEDAPTTSDTSENIQNAQSVSSEITEDTMSEVLAEIVDILETVAQMTDAVAVEPNAVKGEASSSQPSSIATGCGTGQTEHTSEETPTHTHIEVDKEDATVTNSVASPPTNVNLVPEIKPDSPCQSVGDIDARLLIGDVGERTVDDAINTALTRLSVVFVNDSTTPQGDESQLPPAGSTDDIVRETAEAFIGQVLACAVLEMGQHDILREDYRSQAATTTVEDSCISDIKPADYDAAIDAIHDIVAESHTDCMGNIDASAQEVLSALLCQVDLECSSIPPNAGSSHQELTILDEPSTANKIPPTADTLCGSQETSVQELVCLVADQIVKTVVARMRDEWRVEHTTCEGDAISSDFSREAASTPSGVCLTDTTSPLSTSGYDRSQSSPVDPEVVTTVEDLCSRAGELSVGGGMSSSTTHCCGETDTAQKPSSTSRSLASLQTDVTEHVGHMDASEDCQRQTKLVEAASTQPNQVIIDTEVATVLLGAVADVERIGSDLPTSTLPGHGTLANSDSTATEVACIENGAHRGAECEQKGVGCVESDGHIQLLGETASGDAVIAHSDTIDVACDIKPVPTSVRRESPRAETIPDAVVEAPPAVVGTANTVDVATIEAVLEDLKSKLESEASSARQQPEQASTPPSEEVKDALASICARTELLNRAANTRIPQPNETRRQSNIAKQEGRRASTRRPTKRNGSVLAVAQLLAWDVAPEAVDAAESAVKRYATKRRMSRRGVSGPLKLDDLKAASSDPLLLAYDLQREHAQPFSMLDDGLLVINPSGAHIQLDELDAVGANASEIIAKRKRLSYEAYNKAIAQRKTPAFNYAPVAIKFEWSDFVVATPITATSPDVVQKMRLLVKKGVRLPGGHYVIVSAFIRPLEDGNENLRVQIYDSERVEEFLFDFFDDLLHRYVVKWDGSDEQAKEFVSQLEFRREQGAVIIKLPDKKGLQADSKASRVGSTLVMEQPSVGVENRTPRKTSRHSQRRSFLSQRPSTSPELQPLELAPLEPRQSAELSTVTDLTDSAVE